jgi:hypothetical protein
MPSDRSDFLREYYRLLTDDIRRSEGIIPKVCGLEISMVAFLLVVRWRMGPVHLVSIVALLTTTWAMHLLVNANLWALRSHLMATNVEREFFTPRDLNVLLPISYYSETGSYRYRRAFRAPLLLSLAFVMVIFGSLPLSATPETFLVLLLGIVLLASVLIEHRNCAREYAYLVKHAPGRRVTDNSGAL